MCVQCSMNWRGSKKIGPIHYGSGVIADSRKNHMAWVRIGKLFVGYTKFIRSPWTWRPQGHYGPRLAFWKLSIEWYSKPLQLVHVGGSLYMDRKLIP